MSESLIDRYKARALPTLGDKFQDAYLVTTNLVIADGKTTNITDLVNNVSEFDSFVTQLGMDLRQNGLQTYEESTGNLKLCKKIDENWEWFHIPTMPQIIDKINELIGSGSGGSGDGHTHTNKSVIDGITQEKINQWDSKATGGHNHDSVYVKITEYNTLKDTVRTQSSTIVDLIARIEALEGNAPQPSGVPICGDDTICSNDLIVGGTQLKAFSQEPIIEVKSALSEEFLKKYAK